MKIIHNSSLNNFLCDEMNPYIEILRPGNAIMAIISVLLLAFIEKDFNISICLASIAVFLATGAGNVINDYYDYKIDKINRPERPIPSGRISPKTAKIYAFSLFTFSTIIGFIIGLLSGTIVLFSSILMIVYSKFLKSKCLVGNIAVSFLTGLCFVFGGIVVNQALLGVYIMFFAFLMNFAREIIKDIEDVEGDEIEGAKTFPIVYGKKSAAILSSILIILSTILSPILYILGFFNINFIIMLTMPFIIFIYSAVSIIKDYSTENSKKVSKYIKMAMLLVFITFALGSLPPLI